MKGGGQHSTIVSYLLRDPAAPALIPSIPPKKFRGEIIDVTKVYRWRCLEESEQCLENVDLDHLALASGKLALQKRMPMKCSKTINVKYWRLHSRVAQGVTIGWTS